MLIGVPKETKADEYHVGIVSATVAELTSRGYWVMIEMSAGAEAGIRDNDFKAAGAEIITGAAEIFEHG